MISKDFDDYKVANINEDDIQNISKLEKAISEKANQDIVLIAYQSSNKTKAWVLCSVKYPQIHFYFKNEAWILDNQVLMPQKLS